MKSKTRIMKRMTSFIAAFVAVIFAASFVVACKDKPQPDEKIFLLDKTDIELEVDGNGEVLNLTLVGYEEAPEWKSSNETVARVTVGDTPTKATVTGLSEGNALITVSVGDEKRLCAVYVKPEVYITVDNPVINLWQGYTERIETETNAKSLTYRSNDLSVATVSDDGLVTAVGDGSTTVTVSSGSKSQSVTVNVKSPAVSIAEELVLLTLTEGEDTKELTVTANGKVTWHIEDPEIVSIEDNVLTALKIGETVVTATFMSASDEVTVKVKNQILTVTLVDEEGEELEEYKVDLEPADDKQTLDYDISAVVTPEQTEDDKIGFTYEVTSGSNVVSVDENGKVTTKAGVYGSAVVRVTSKADADAYADLSVNVLDPMRDWIKISDKASLEAAFKAGNENKNMYLTCDIDLDGAALNSTLGNYNGTFDGRGNEIMNFTCPNALFGGLDALATIKNLAITGSVGKSGGDWNGGLFGQFLLGKIENCRFDITLTSNNESGIAHHDSGNANLSNVIMLIRISGVSGAYADMFLNAQGTWTNVYCAVEGSATAPKGATRKTMDELKDASLYASGWDTTVWSIEDGEIPVLINGGGVTGVTISMTSATVHKNDTLTLTASVKPAKLPSADKTYTWSSSDNTIATVDENGVVTALKEGTVTITATSDKDNTKYASCTITVDAATAITVTSSTSVRLELGGGSKITATVNHGTISYESNDTDIVIVDADGLISAVSAGETDIIITSSDSPSVTATVHVKVMPAVNVGLKDGEPSEKQLEIGETHTILLEINRDDDNGVWSSSNTAVATVANGVVTAVAAGNANVTYTSGLNPNKTVVVRIMVMPAVVITVQPTLTIMPNTPAQLGASANRGTLTYESDNEAVVTVDENGVLTGIAEGSATITVTSAINPAVTATCVVTVSADAEVTISLNKTELTLDWNGTATLVATANVSTVTWSSSDPTVATVDENGVVTALKKNGTATITASAMVDGSAQATATCEVTVAYVDPVIDIMPDEDKALEIGDTLDFTYSVTKGTVEVTLEGDDTTCVNLTGRTVTALAAGTVTVKFTVTDEGEVKTTAQFTVTVKPAPTVTITNKNAVTGGIYIGGTAKLEATASRTDGTIAWSSSDDTIATVDNSGNVTTFTKTGDVTITATFTTTLGKAVSDTVTFNVYSEATIELKLAARSVAVGGTYTVEVTAQQGGDIVWASSNTAVATVDNNGTVRGVAVGKSNVTATINGKKATIVIAVYNKAAGATEVSTAAEFKAIKSGTYYIVNDIDVGGEVVTGWDQGVRVDGLGYTVSNFKTPALVGGEAFTGEFKNIKISCEIGGQTTPGRDYGLFGLYTNGAVIENCIFDVKFIDSATNQGVLAHHMVNNGKISNIIIIINAGTKAGCPGFVITDGGLTGAINDGRISNAFYMLNDGASVGGVYGVIEKTEAQLKTASTFDSTWDNGWVIVDGQMPMLKGALVTDPLKVQVNKSTDELYVGETTTITATVTGDDLTDADKNVRWTSSDETIATVADGVVTAKKAGTVTITATSTKESGKSASCTVTVKAITLSVTAEGGITTLKKDGTVNLDVEINRGAYTYETSKDDVVTISDDTVTAVGEGTVTITVRSKLDPTVTATIDITVQSIINIEVDINEDSLELDREAEGQLSYSISNSNNGVTWSSSDESVATVDQNGKVTAGTKDGTAVITATSIDDKGDGTHASASIAVTVTYVPVVITLKQDSVNMFKDGALAVSDVATANKGGLTFSVEDGDDVVTVADGKLMAIGAGEATVRVTSTISYDDVTAVYEEFTVSVTVAQVEMTMDVTKRSLHVGGTGSAWRLNVALDPSPASAEIVWTSSNDSVVSVSGDSYVGTLTTKALGKATITATYTADGTDYTATCDIEVFNNTNNANAIATAEQLKTIAATPGARWYLANDIDFTGIEITSNYIGNMINVQFDGKGYALKNITTKFASNEQGFINMLDGGTVIENVNFVNFDLGAEANMIFGGIIYNVNGASTIRNCYFEGVISAQGNPNEAFFGAIGVQWNSTIEHCVFNVGLAENYPSRGKNATPRAMIGRWIMGTTQDCVSYDRSSGKMYAAPGDGGAATDKYADAFKTDDELKTAATFDGWDTTVWVIADGEYPRLRTAWDN